MLRSNPVHPRTRGEDPTWAVGGSGVGRFTPARAGKTLARPHGALSIPGSPPHARGRPAGGRCDVTVARFTPARAGKTLPLQGRRD